MLDLPQRKVITVRTGHILHFLCLHCAMWFLLAKNWAQPRWGSLPNEQANRQSLLPTHCCVNLRVYSLILRFCSPGTSSMTCTRILIATSLHNINSTFTQAHSPTATFCGQYRQSDPGFILPSMAEILLWYPLLTW